MDVHPSLLEQHTEIARSYLEALDSRQIMALGRAKNQPRS
jgi:hypothetical protein